jgi:hypothetical protein
MTTDMRITLRRMLFLLSVIACATCLTTFAQTPPVPGECNVPASQRGEENGCYLSAIQTLGALPADARRGLRQSVALRHRRVHLETGRWTAD